MSQMRFLFSLFASFLLSASSAFAKEEKIPQAEWAALLAKADAKEVQGDDMKAMMEIHLINKAGQKRLRSAVFFQRGSDTRLIQFKQPASEAGLSVLIRGEEIHLYLPQLQSTRRIASHVKNQPFMGTDLSFDDMGSLFYSKTNDVIDAVRTPTGIRLTLRGKPGSGKAYASLQLLLRKNDHQILQVGYFDAKGKEYKRMTRSDFHKTGRFSVPATIEFRDLLTEHRTVMILTGLQLNTKISSKIFTTRYLTRDLEL